MPTSVKVVLMPYLPSEPRLRIDIVPLDIFYLTRWRMR